MNKPIVSIVMPVYNASKYLREAIDSIIQQTYENFEFIIINDGSSDDSKDIILSYEDPRIVYVDNQNNKGLIFTLNKGISLSKGKYIVRMDADDQSLSRRIALQVDFMEENPDIVVCGGQIEYISEDAIKKERFYAPLSDHAIKNRLFVASPIAHPTSVIRRSVLVDDGIYYDSDYTHCEDYKFWVDLANSGQMANLDEPLLKYRLSPNQISQKYKSTAMISSLDIQRIHAYNLFGDNNLNFRTIFQRVLDFPSYSVFLLKSERLAVTTRLFLLFMSLVRGKRLDKLVAFKAFLRGCRCS